MQQLKLFIIKNWKTRWL